MTSRIAFFTLLSLGALACGEGDDEVIINPEAAEVPDNAAAALTTYADIALASYSDSLQAAQTLDSALQQLVSDPSEATMSAARQAWRDAREPYLQTEVYRFYGGPIDDEDGPEGLLNAWPMDEFYIDYVEGPMGETRGIINDDSVPIDAATLESLNEADGDENIATGYHAIEFLLWGQDFRADGPGERPFTDYVVGDAGTAANQERRGQYLLTVSEMLVGHLQGLVDEWESNSEGNYRAGFLAMEPKAALELVTGGAAILAGFETGGERLAAALESKNQEEEHSCFSDNTHRDMIQDIQGIENVWLGTYQGLTAATTVSGTGLHDVFAVEDPAIADAISDEIATAMNAALAMEQEGPFDQLILEGNSTGETLVQAVIDSLVTLEEIIEDQAMPLFDLSKIDPDSL